MQFGEVHDFASSRTASLRTDRDAGVWLRLLVVLDVRSQQPADLLKAVAEALNAHRDDVKRERFARLAEVNGQ